MDTSGNLKTMTRNDVLGSDDPGELNPGINYTLGTIRQEILSE